MLKYSLCTNMVAISRKAKTPKARAKVVYRRSYKRFAKNHCVEDVRNVDWNGGYTADNPEVSLTAFMNIFMETVKRTCTYVKVHS